jgi:uncharacterized protein (DUF4213/DUF364 family)
MRVRTIATVASTLTDIHIKTLQLELAFSFDLSSSNGCQAFSTSLSAITEFKRFRCTVDLEGMPKCLSQNANAQTKSKSRQARLCAEP